MDQVLHDLNARISERDPTNSEIEQLLLQLYHLTKHASSITLSLNDEKLAMTTLGWYAFGVSPDAKQVALRCLHNILYLVPSMRQIFVDHQYPKKAATLIKNHDTEPAAIAILMLCRLRDTTFDYNLCLEDDDLLDKVHQSIAREAETATPPHGNPASSLNTSLLFLSIIAARCERSTRPNPFFESRHPILQLLGKAPILSPPLQPPLPLLMHAVGVVLSDDTTRTNNDLSISKSLVDKVTEILFRAMQVHKDDRDFESEILPPLEFLLSLASSCELDMRKHLGLLLLPSGQDRASVLGNGRTLAHQLISMSVKASRPELKFLLAKLLFELSGNDPQQLILNVGFGCASGLLPILGKDITYSPATHGQNHGDINLVTGQRREAEPEPEPDTHDWTDEEKQREAERLFVLFERLKAAGVGVENPVDQAVRENRLVDLED